MWISIGQINGHVQVDWDVNVGLRKGLCEINLMAMKVE